MLVAFPVSRPRQPNESGNLGLVFSLIALLTEHSTYFCDIP